MPRERIMFRRGSSLWFNNDYTPDGWTKGILHEIIRINADLNGDVKYILTLVEDSLDFFVCEPKQVCFQGDTLNDIMSEEQILNMLECQQCKLLYSINPATQPKSQKS